MALASREASLVRLLPAGSFESIHGQGPFWVADVDGLCARSLAMLPMRIERASMHNLASRAEEDEPRLGLIVALAVRRGELWGKAAWTPLGRLLVEGQAVRFIGAGLVANQCGVIERLSGCFVTAARELRHEFALASEEPIALADEAWLLATQWPWITLLGAAPSTDSVLAPPILDEGPR